MRGGTGGWRCEGCGADRGAGGAKLLECAGCASAFFCSPACQQKSWRTGHKKICRERRRAAVKVQAGWRGWSARRRVLRKLLSDAAEAGEVEVCEVCGRSAPKGKELDVCDGCKLSLFCSRRCQRSGWKEHKIVCRERQRAAVKIQAAWRRCRERRAAVKIQAAWRRGRNSTIENDDDSSPCDEDSCWGCVVTNTLLCACFGVILVVLLCLTAVKFLVLKCSAAVSYLRQRENIAAAKRRAAHAIRASLPLVILLATCYYDQIREAQQAGDMLSFVYDEPLPTLERIVPVVPAIIHGILKYDSPRAKVGAMRALEHISKRGNNYIHALLDAGAAEALVGTLGDTTFERSGLRAMANIAKGGYEQMLLDAGFMYKVASLLDDTDSEKRMYALLALAHVVARPGNEVELFLSDSVVVLKVIGIATSDRTWKVRKIAIGIIDATTRGGTERQVTYLADNGAIDALCSIDTSDTSMVESVVETIRRWQEEETTEITQAISLILVARRSYHEHLLLNSASSPK